MSARILVVDDDRATREVLKDKLASLGHQVTDVASAEEALSQLKSLEPRIVLTDVRMPGMSGIDLLEKLRSVGEEVDVLVMTGHEDMESAVGAMKAGAFDYLVKPLELGVLEKAVERCLEEQELAREARKVDEEADEPERRGPVVGRDPRMIEIFKMIGVLAQNRATVLVRGETGTGKEMVARAIHGHSLHAGEPFVAVNCTALTATLLQSELFGHEKGAFTGAVSGRRGYFELAGKGTIFLDEIGDTTPEFQTKLLRVLQDRTFFPVGGEEPRTTQARVIAATHQPLEELVDEGAFREDLYFRLKVVEINVPPLRERKGDIPVLARHLLDRVAEETGHDVEHISSDAMEKLRSYDWPGNVRELENVLTRAAILARGRAIGTDHLALGEVPVFAFSRQDDAAEEAARTLDSVIAEHVQRVLHFTEGNKSEAARVLEISRSRLSRMVDRYDLEVPD